jgi:hypothetical protein
MVAAVSQQLRMLLGKISIMRWDASYRLRHRLLQVLLLLEGVT